MDSFDMDTFSYMKLPDFSLEKATICELRDKIAEDTIHEEKRELRKRQGYELDLAIEKQKKHEADMAVKESEEKARLEAARKDTEMKQRSSCVDEFMFITGKQDKSKCNTYLDVFGFNLEKALSSFYERGTFEQLTGSAVVQESSPQQILISLKLPTIDEPVMQSFNYSDTLFTIAQYISAHHAHIWQYQHFHLTDESKGKVYSEDDIHSITLAQAGIDKNSVLTIKLGRANVY